MPKSPESTPPPGERPGRFFKVLERHEVDIRESRLFDEQEVMNIIRDVDDIDSQDLILVDKMTDTDGRIIHLIYELRPVVSYQRFGRSAQYEFWLKGNYGALSKDSNFPREDSFDITSISRLLLSQTELDEEEGKIKEALREGKSPDEIIQISLESHALEELTTIAEFVDGRWMMNPES